MIFSHIYIILVFFNALIDEVRPFINVSFYFSYWLTNLYKTLRYIVLQLIFNFLLEILENPFILINGLLSIIKLSLVLCMTLFLREIHQSLILAPFANTNEIFSLQMHLNQLSLFIISPFLQFSELLLCHFALLFDTFSCIFS